MGDKYNRFNPQKIPQKKKFLPMLCSKPAIKDSRPPRSDRERSESFSSDPLSPRIGCMGQVKRNNRVAGLPLSHRILITTKNAVLNNKNGNTPNVGYLKLKKFFSSKNLLAASPSSTVAAAGTNRSAAAAGVNGCGSSRRRAAPGCAISGKKKGVCENRNCAISGKKKGVCENRNCAISGKKKGVCENGNCAISSEKKGVCENGNHDSFSVVDLDPPLPVVRRVKMAREEGGETENLWKRRSGGVVLQSLQIQQTHLPKDRLQIATV